MFGKSHVEKMMPVLLKSLRNLKIKFSEKRMKNNQKIILFGNIVGIHLLQNQEYCIIELPVFEMI